LHIAGDCFRDVLKDFSITDEKADLARRGFIAIRLSQKEDLRDRLIRIASKFSNDNSPSM
jgi:hypothetical protein